MSKERLSRIDYLRDKLSQMGHPPANRIVWEKELEELLKQSKPTKIEGSIKPRKCNHVAWNRKLLQGYKSDKSRWLPPGYFRSHVDYVIPPYLLATWKAFLAGDPIHGQRWYNTAAPELSASHWGCKKSKKQVREDPEVRAEFKRDVDQFFKLMPCVPFHEAASRFPAYVFEKTLQSADTSEAIKEREKARAEAKDAKKAKAEAEAKEAQENRLANIATQDERVKAGRAAFIAKFGKSLGDV